jgi:hypothetical protein
VLPRFAGTLPEVASKFGSCSVPWCRPVWYAAFLVTIFDESEPPILVNKAEDQFRRGAMPLYRLEVILSEQRQTRAIEIC